MARIRTIKPEFWTSEQVMECSPIARLMFIGLWNFCDDTGRQRLSLKHIKALIFPSDNITTENILLWFEELSSNGLLTIYVVDDKEYFQITGWHHQKIDKPQQSKYPPMRAGDAVPFCERSTNGIDGEEGKGEERKGEEKKENKNAPIGAKLKSVSTNGTYAFEAGVIKLNAKDLEQWRKAFPNLSLESELTGLADWARKQPNWFPAVSGALAKRQRESVLAIERMRIEAEKGREPEKPPSPIF